MRSFRFAKVFTFCHSRKQTLENTFYITSCFMKAFKKNYQKLETESGLNVPILAFLEKTIIFVLHQHQTQHIVA